MFQLYCQPGVKPCVVSVLYRSALSGHRHHEYGAICLSSTIEITLEDHRLYVHGNRRVVECERDGVLLFDLLVSIDQWNQYSFEIASIYI